MGRERPSWVTFILMMLVDLQVRCADSRNGTLMVSNTVLTRTLRCLLGDRCMLCLVHMTAHLSPVTRRRLFQALRRDDRHILLRCLTNSHNNRHGRDASISTPVLACGHTTAVKVSTADLDVFGECTHIRSHG